MARRPAPLIGALALAAMLGAALAGCATATPSSGADATPQATETPAGELTEFDAAWLDGGRQVGLVTQGSSTCIPTAEDVSYADGVLQLTLADVSDGPCTMDYVPRVSLVPVPDDVDPSANLAIEVSGDYVGEMVLPGVEGLAAESPSEQLPSAGWTTTDGTFIVLLWGSSGCPEYITTAEVSGDAAISVSLSDQPADKVCTADIAPNPQLTTVDGLVGVPDVALTLNSPGVDPYTTPILGVNGGTAG